MTAMPRLDYMLPADPDRGNLRALRRHHKARMRARAVAIYVDQNTRAGYPSAEDRDTHSRWIGTRLGDNITSSRDWWDPLEDLRLYPPRWRNRWLRELAEDTTPVVDPTDPTDPANPDLCDTPSQNTPTTPFNPVLTPVDLVFAAVAAGLHCELPAFVRMFITPFPVFSTVQHHSVGTP
jgi:hypothetical protein